MILFSLLRRVPFVLLLATTASGQVLEERILDSFNPTGVAAAGDVNGDGVEDLVVGTPLNLQDNNKGAIWVLFLGPDKSVIGQQKINPSRGGFQGHLDSQDRFGTAVSGLGDLDGDGVPDVAATAPGDDDGSLHYLFSTGAVWILFLNRDGTVKAHQKISATRGQFDGNLVDGHGFGTSVTAVGDVDGDGVVDLAVGSPMDDDGPGRFERGSVWILYLERSGRVKSEARISAGSGGFQGLLLQGDRFGSSVGAAGDVDGNGVPDLWVGASGDDAGGPDRGALWRLLLRPDGSVLAHQKIRSGSPGFTHLEDGVLFGTSVQQVGDLDGDGLEEILVGAEGDQEGLPPGSGGRTIGAIWVIAPDATGTVLRHRKLSAERGGLQHPPGAFDDLGRSVAGLGDLDGDGVLEVALGSRPLRLISLADCPQPAGTAFVPLTNALSVSRGGGQCQCLAASSVLGGSPYVVIGSMTGTSPGFTTGGVHVPLVPDAYTSLTLTGGASAVFRNFSGLLDADGRAVSQLRIPRLSPALVGTTLHHAYVVFGPGGQLVGASNPISVRLVP